MLEAIIKFSLRNRLLICVLTGVLVVSAFKIAKDLPIDAFPDTTPVQVQINTRAPALSPEEIEAQITFPIELSISGLPGLGNVRSISKFGLSQVVATFNDETSIFLARQLIGERLQAVELPEGLDTPEMGPISTGLGEVFHYVLKSDNPERSLTELRELHDWVVKPELRKVSGTAEINSWGGFEKQFQVIASPDKLIKYRLTLDEVFEALEANNQNAGGGQVVTSGESHLVQGIGLARSLEDIGNIVISSYDGTPVRISDVADVQLGHEIRGGAVTADGAGEAVLGLGFMIMGENSHVVTRALKEKLSQVQMALPDDVIIEAVYDRTELVDKVINTVGHNLVAGALLVIVVLFALIGNFRAGLIVALSVPLSLLFAGNFMLQAGIAASLLSLGALDFGMVVDGSIVMVENMMRRLTEKQQSLGRALSKTERWDIISDAPLEVVRPIVFGVGIVTMVFIPILTLEGIEGKLFRPMALTMVAALLGSLILALTLTPVLASLTFQRRLKDTEPWLVRKSHRLYQPVLDTVLRFQKVTLASALLVVLLAGLGAMRLGGEFLPKLKEGAIVANVIRLAGVSIDESTAYNTQIEKSLLEEFPEEIERVWSRIGTAEVATDPMGIELTDIFITLKPRSEWKKARTQDGLMATMDEFLSDLPGLNMAFTQPIEMRMNEMVAGIRSDIGIKIYGDDFATLNRISDDVQRVLSDIEGSSDISGEQITGQPVLQVKVDPEAIARYGVSTRDVLDFVEAVGTRHVGEIREGQRRFPLVVRLPDRQRQDRNVLARTLIPTSEGSIIPLATVADIRLVEGPATIQREWSKRRMTVQCNVRGRDVGSFVAEAQRRIIDEVDFPEGYTVDWGGQFENMERANQRLMLVVPLTLGLIFILLYFSLGTVRDVLIVASGIPLGAVGGIVALALRGMPLTVSAAIGFIALSGVAILNGLVLVTFIKQRLDAGGTSLTEAVRKGCQVRLRPVLMTAITTAVGLVPMALNTGVGAEVQSPLATVVIGGVITNTLLTLMVLPALYCTFGRNKEELQRDG